MIAATSIFTPVTYLPQRPSPLSPRSTNVLCLPFSPLMADAKKSSINVPFSKRPIKANPIMHTRDEMRERRRDLFLKRVQQDREEKRLEQRGDRIMRADFLSKQRRWEETLARSAPPPVDPDAEFDESSDEIVFNSQEDHPWFSSLPHSSQQFSSSNFDDQQEAEAALSQEQRELEELIQLMEDENQEQDRRSSAQEYGSDEEDYDSLFMDLVDVDGFFHQQADQGFSCQDTDAMDMTNG